MSTILKIVTNRHGVTLSRLSPARCHIVPIGGSGGPFPPNGPAVCSRTTARTGIALRRGTIEPGRTARREPRQCHIVVVLTTATSHHGGSAVGDAGAVVIGALAGVAGEPRLRRE